MTYRNKEDHNAYQRQYKANNRSTAIAAFGGKCQECGSADDLNFHHRNPELKTDHNIWSWSRERREAELAKCDLICRECHLNKHVPRKDHGIKAYERRGCRCEVCKAVKAERNRKYRKPKGKRSWTQLAKALQQMHDSRLSTEQHRKK